MALYERHQAFTVADLDDCHLDTLGDLVSAEVDSLRVDSIDGTPLGLLSI